MDATSAGMIGKYQVIRVLGRGGMGEVVLAQDDLGRRVAIKRPFKSALEDGLARFKLEARASTLSHPNIPVVYEMGMQDGLPFIAMEFVEGDPLDKLISSGKPLDLITKLSIIEQVCAGLGHAHQKGIIHRDIKPANVIVQPNGVAKIIDFGIAKIQNLEQTSGLTQTSAIIGSLHYIAPERFKGEAIDGRVDIFSAGVMLYLLLTGNLPFAGGEATASYRIVNEAHGTLSAYIRDYPPALDGIVDQALAKDPDDRYTTAEDFADALHEVIEELKKKRVFELFDDAERLTTESRFAPALELLDEAMKLDPANTQVRKLRKFVREHQERQKRAERLREYLVRADELLAAENYAEALNLLKEAQRLDATFPELAEKIQAVEEKKRRYESSMAALTEAAAVRDRGDLNGALRVVDRAIQQDPENSKLLALRGVLAKQVETEALQGKVLALLETARRELAAQHFPAVEQLLLDAEAIDPSHPKIDELRRELGRIKEQEERRQLLDEIHRRVNEFLRNDNYEQAADLLNRAIDRLPTETTLHRLKVEVDTGARRYGAKQFVDGAIAAAREKFVSAPLEALAGLQKAIEQMPGEERLIAYERSLRQQFDSNRSAQLLADTLRKARESMAERQFDRAITVLEAYHLEFGNQPDVDEMLTLARNELAARERRKLVERTSAEVRSLIGAERLDDAVRLLESVMKDSSDPALGRLLEEVRQQQAALARKFEVVQKRVSLLRERGELDEAIQVLQEYLAASPKSPTIQDLLSACLAEREHRQAVQQAIASAREAVKRREFTTALEALETVQRAYGESAELTQEIEQTQSQRASIAQEAVGRSIENARAALLKKDPEGALAALKESAAMVEFADQKRQADWQRIAKTAKDDLRRTPTTSSTAALDELTNIGPPLPQRKPMGLILGVAGVVVLAIGGIVWWKMQSPSPPPPGSTQAHIVIAKAPPGSQVSIDGKPSGVTDAQGTLSVPVKAGTYHLVVSKDNFASFTDDVTVSTGETYHDTALLSALPPVGKSGTLAIKGNLPKFKLYVDDVYKGFVSDGKPIALEVGTHTVRYSAPGYVDSANKTITIALNKETPDTFNLAQMAAPPPNVGNLTISTNPGAHILIDGGKESGVANQNGSFTFNGLTPGNHTVATQLDGFVPGQPKQVSVLAGQNANADAQMIPVAPTLAFFKADQTSIESGQYANLSWQVNNASNVAIDGGPAGASGTKSVNPDHTTTYQLTANNGAVNLGQVTVTVRPKPVAVVTPTPVTEPTPVTPKPVDNSADIQAIQDALGRFKAAYESKNIGRVKAEWLNIGDKRAKMLEGVFQQAEISKISETCPGQPAISGSSAEWHCTELFQFSRDSAPKPQAKTLTFTKQGAKWVMKDKVP